MYELVCQDLGSRRGCDYSLEGSSSRLVRDGIIEHLHSDHADALAGSSLQSWHELEHQIDETLIHSRAAWSSSGRTRGRVWPRSARCRLARSVSPL